MLLRPTSLLTLLALMFCAGCGLDRPYTGDSGRLEMPASLGEARIVAGQESFRKEAFYRTTEVGEVSQLLTGWPAERYGAVLSVVGNDGAVFLAANLETKHRVTLSEQLCPAQLVRLGPGGKFGFLNRSHSGACDVMLFGEEGKLLWRYSGEVGVTDAAAADVDGDGIPEIAVGFIGDGGLHLVSIEGRRIWRKADGNVWHTEMVDTSGDGRCEILSTSGGGALTIRNGQGDVVAERRPARYISDFNLAPSRDGEPMVLAPEEGAVHLISVRGDRLHRLSAPGLSDMGSIYGAPVQFVEGKAHFAALVGYRNWGRSMLMVYDGSNNLVYQEVLASNCGAISAYPGKGGESLLVGCGNVIWEYKPTWNPSSH